MEQAGKDRWFVVFNPMAGSRCASQLLKEIESALLGNGMDYEPFFIKEDISILSGLKIFGFISKLSSFPFIATVSFVN